jgi:uncharacterized protein (DUF488 family)
MVPDLFTIGYERATLADLIARLRSAGVEIVVDVRAVAASRRPGFSKKTLAASLDEAGIAYIHLRALGTPKAGREAARAGRTAEMRRIYADHLDEPDAQVALSDACEIATTQKAALLCFEADAARCHRAIVASLLQERTGCRIVDL